MTDPLRAQAASFADVPAGRMAYRKLGSGPPLLCVHGWPFSSLSFRFVAPKLAERFTCYFPDSPGLGETELKAGEKLTFANQAETFRAFLDALKLPAVSILATDTGASISRRLALIAPERVSRLAIMNTEMPGHRPPWIQFFQKTTLVPGAELSFRMLLKSRAFQHSSMGMGGCFVDHSRIDDPDFQACSVRPLLERKGALNGVIRYLQGIDWKLIDDFAVTHRELKCPVLAVWGADDPTFPIEQAREMVKGMPTCVGLREIPGAALLVHEEKPDEVLREVVPFLAG